jgi:hypothetical protein
LPEGSDDTPAAEIDRALAVWRQGDLALAEKWFVYAADGSAPLTPAAAALGPGIQALTVECAGLVVVSQTCDIVRKCTERPFLEVSPLRRVSEEEAHQVAQGFRPAFAPIAVSTELVADLDRTMTVEKSIVARWTRTPGWIADAEVRWFAWALARKRERFAFPDDFVRGIDRLRKKIVDKHGRISDEGRALATLVEIRATAAPSWDAPQCEAFLSFIRPETTPDISDEKWAEHLEVWLKLCHPRGTIASIDGAVMPLSRLTAKEYVDSDRLDFDHLSA